MTATGTLGKPFRVIYTSKGFVTGLTQITCKIIRADLVISPTNPMYEFTDDDLKGCYYYDLETTEQDPAGDYIVIINNPEQLHKEGYRIHFQTQTESVALDSISAGFKKDYFS